MEFKQYPSYKNSDVEWLGDVPEHWDVIPSKFYFTERKEKATALDKQLTASQKYGIVFQDDYMAENGRVMVVMKNPEILKKVHPYDFVISMRSFQGGLELSYLEGAISSAYVMLKPNLNLVDIKYFKYLFKTTRYIQSLQSTSNLIRDGQALRFNNFSQVKLVLPPKIEQQKIVSFLDIETARINDLIRKQKELLELFKKNIIALAMSEQMNGKGELVRLSYVTYEVKRPVHLCDETEYIALGIYNRGRGLFHKPPTLGKDIGDSDFFYVDSGDLILSGQFAWEGAVTIATNNELGCVVSHRYPILRGNLISTEYLFALFISDYGDYLLNDSSRGSAGRNRPLNTNLLLKHKIRMPSDETQNEIKRLLDLKARLEITVNKTIEKLKEYRNSVVGNAVTGKIDVWEYTE